MIIAARSPAEQDPAYGQLGILKQVVTLPPGYLCAGWEKLLSTEMARAIPMGGRYL